MSNELVWAYCDKCGTKFSKHQKGFERYCPECHVEAKKDRARRVCKEDYIHSFRMIFDPSGDYPKGAIFSTIDMAYTLTGGGFDEGSKFIWNRDRHWYTVKDKMLVNEQKILKPVHEYYLKAIERKRE